MVNSNGENKDIDDVEDPKLESFDSVSEPDDVGKLETFEPRTYTESEEAGETPYEEDEDDGLSDTAKGIETAPKSAAGTPSAGKEPYIPRRERRRRELIAEPVATSSIASSQGIEIRRSNKLIEALVNLKSYESSDYRKLDNTFVNSKRISVLVILGVVFSIAIKMFNELYGVNPNTGIPYVWTYVIGLAVIFGTVLIYSGVLRGIMSALRDDDSSGAWQVYMGIALNVISFGTVVYLIYVNYVQWSINHNVKFSDFAREAYKPTTESLALPVYNYLAVAPDIFLGLSALVGFVYVFVSLTYRGRSKIAYNLPDIFSISRANVVKVFPVR